MSRRKKPKHTFKYTVRSLAAPVTILIKLIQRELGKPKGWKPVPLKDVMLLLRNKESFLEGLDK